MMKLRNKEEVRVVFGFNGPLQEDLECYQGVMRVASREGWGVIGVYEHFERGLRRLAEAGAVDGVIGNFISEEWLGILPERLALVHVGRHRVSGRISGAVVDAREVGERAGRHLSESGYEEFAVLEHPGQPASRLQVGSFCRELGSVEEEVRVRTMEEMRERLERLDGPVGVFCYSDYHARQVIRLAVGMGREVPEDVGVLGVGDRFWDGLAAEMEISSLPLPRVAMGMRAAELLVERLEGRPPRTVYLPPGEVIARASTLRGSGGGRLVSEVEGVFRANLRDPPGMAEVARRVGMSRRGFEVSFRQAAGCSPYARLLEMRLEESRTLLLHSGWTVARVGEAVGYPEASRFNAFFRQHMGESPGRWRENRLDRSSS